MAVTNCPTKRYVDPFDPHWAAAELGALAARAAAGEDPDRLRAQLLHDLWPWAIRVANRAAARLPASADRNTTRSEVLLAVWQATQRINWDQATTWPAMLRQRIRGAQVDAARADDTLSRRLRQAQLQLSREVASLEQAQGRHLSTREQSELAVSMWPRSRPEWMAYVLREEVGSFDSDWSDTRRSLSPEEHCLEAERRESVRAWVHRLPPTLATDVVAWLGQPKPRATLPARLRARLTPYLDDLRTLVPVEDTPVPAAA